MNFKQEDKLSMYYVVKSTCEKYQSTWVTNAVFAATYNLWAPKLVLIEQNRDAQFLETSGITTDKTVKRATMTDKAMFIEKRLQSYANVINNPELLESVQYSTSDFNKARDSNVIGICNAVLAKANANIAALAPYGVTAALITEFQNAITAYSATLAKPKAAMSQSKTATENLTRFFNEADALLKKRLDLDIEVFKNSKPEFYSQYKTARIIIPTAGGQSSVIGSVIDAENGELLKGVSFTFIAMSNSMEKAVATEKSKPIAKKSAAKGKFRAQLPENSYKVIIEKTGFKSQEIEITVINGKTTNLNIKLARN